MWRGPDRPGRGLRDAPELAQRSLPRRLGAVLPGIDDYLTCERTTTGHVWTDNPSPVVEQVKEVGQGGSSGLPRRHDVHGDGRRVGAGGDRQMAAARWADGQDGLVQELHIFCHIYLPHWPSHRPGSGDPRAPAKPMAGAATSTAPPVSKIAGSGVCAMICARRSHCPTDPWIASTARTSWST